MIGLMRLLVMAVLCTSPISPAIGATGDSIGRMPEIVVTAHRYYIESTDEIGMMPEVVVTAKRYSASDEHVQSQRQGYNETSFLSWVFKYLLWISVVSCIVVAGLLTFAKLQSKRQAHARKEAVSPCCV